MTKLSKDKYLGWIIGGFLAGLVFMGVGAAFYIRASNARFDAFASTISSIGFLLGSADLIIATVMLCKLLYRAWQSIQDGQPRTTPGKAIGLMFIPFFNLYWVFVAYWGLSRDYNSYLKSKSIGAPAMNEKLFLSFAILILCSALLPIIMLASAFMNSSVLTGALQWITLAVAIAACVLFIIIVPAMIKAINNLAV